MYIYYLTITSLVWNKTDTVLLKYVSFERQQKIFRYLNDSDKKNSLYAALIIRMCFNQLTGIPAYNLSFNYKDNHKPQFISRSGYDFNISHTHNFILCCIDKNGIVGIDAEKIQQAPLEIMSRVFHKQEIEYVENSLPRQKNQHFYEIWTKKEAYTKKMGYGLACNLTSCNTLSHSISQHLHSWKQNGYMCCVCTNNSFIPRPIKLSEKDLYNYYLT